MPARIITIWGVFGFLAIIVQAVYRLTPRALEPIREGDLGLFEWTLYGLSIAFSLYAEGYRAFHRQVAPRVVARGFYLAERATFVRAVLAPLFCVGLFFATRKRLITTWIVYGTLVCVIIAVKRLDQPWRGIIDAGVVIALASGCVSIVYFFLRALAGHEMPVPTDVPDSAD